MNYGNYKIKASILFNILKSGIINNNYTQNKRFADFAMYLALLYSFSLYLFKVTFYSSIVLKH